MSELYDESIRDWTLNQIHNVIEDLGKISRWVGVYLNVVSDSSYTIENRY